MKDYNKDEYKIFSSGFTEIILDGIKMKSMGSAIMYLESNGFTNHEALEYLRLLVSEKKISFKEEIK